MPFEDDDAYRVNHPLTLSPTGEGPSGGVTEGVILIAGAGATGDRDQSVLRPNLRKQPSVRKKARGKGTIIPPEIRLAFRTLWTKAQECAADLVSAAKADDPIARVAAVDALDRTLSQLWNHRAYRDINWQSIVNHTQGML